jgi:2-isopropylmalate synthase
VRSGDGRHRADAGRPDHPQSFDVLYYAEHAIGQGADTTAVAYIETVRGDQQVRWDVGTDANITTASLCAVLAAFERQLD